MSLNVILGEDNNMQSYERVQNIQEIEQNVF